MAVAASDTAGTKEEEDDMTCAVCHEVYRHPKLLECTHTFCQQCLVDYVGAASSFFCPMCRRHIKLPPGGVAAFRNNPYLRQHELDAARRVVRCKQHDKKEVELFCRQCDAALCVLCMMEQHVKHDVLTLAQAASEHDKEVELFCGQCDAALCVLCMMEQHVKHDVLTLAQATSEHGKKEVELFCGQCDAALCVLCMMEQHVKHDVLTLAQAASEHDKKEVELFCHQCDAALCVLCMMEQHVKHDVLTLAQAASEVTDQLAEDKSRTERAVDDARQHVREAEAKQQALQDKKVALEKDIRHKHASLVAAADRLRDNALNSLHSVTADIEHSVTSDLNLIRNELTDLLKLQTRVEEATGDAATDHERVTVAKDMRCGAGSPDVVREKAKRRISTVSRPVLRCSEADLSPVEKKMEEYVGVVVRLERRDSLALSKHRPLSAGSDSHA